jgi:hypothetical protein
LQGELDVPPTRSKRISCGLPDALRMRGVGAQEDENPGRHGPPGKTHRRLVSKNR